MRAVFIFITMLIVTMMLRPHCQKSVVSQDCVLVCSDSGYDLDSVVQTGFFSYNCQCKRRPEVKIPERR